MNPNPSTEEVTKRYGLETIPENVRRLAQLLAREDATTEQLAAVISQDKNLTARLLRAANPKATHEDEYVVTSVDQALMRTGVGCALMLIMGDLLIRAVLKTFLTMITVQLEAVAPSEIPSFSSDHILGEIKFSGKANGTVNLRLSPAAAGVVAARLLGCSPGEISAPSEMDDVIGELTNIITGNFQSNLCDAGLPCKLSTPGITRTAEFQLRKVSGGQAERIGFRATELNLFADISVNPWDR